MIIRGHSFNLRSKRSILAGGAGLLIFGFLAFKFFSGGLSAADETLNQKFPAVSVEECQTREIKRVFRGFGTVQAWKEVILKPNSLSIVREVLAKVGDRVTENQILLKSNSEVQEIRAELEKVEFELKNLDFGVTMALAKKKFLSSKEVQQKSLEHKSNLLRSKLMKIENAGVLRTPIAGVISEFDFKEGEYVDNNSTSSIRVVDVSHLKIPLYVPQNIVGYLDRDMDVSIQRDPKQEPALAKISSIAPSVDSKTGSVYSEIAVMNPPKDLLPGMYVEIEVPIQSAPEAKSVSAASLIREGDKVFVYKIDQTLDRGPASEDDSREIVKVIKVEVKTGLQQGDFVQIQEGLEEFDQVVVRGASALSDGTAVEIIR
ncbi:MAG: efflux RND transporter periplasmic adaptor subunit [Bdellovibrionales bacterium]|nr:efflux RND transporter periplasmic adaptor subunit [Bdellovibrionales bacterium]